MKKRMITITEKQDKFLQNNYIKLSPLIRGFLDKYMEDYKNG